MKARSKSIFERALMPLLFIALTVCGLAAARADEVKTGMAFKDCAADCPEMVVIPAGSFVMGSPPTESGRQLTEAPQHNVTIAAPFAVAKFATTFAQWDACAAQSDCLAHVSDHGWGRDRQPVINVSWADAQRYVAWLAKISGKTYRLLSEAEYEYAMRAGTQTAYPWGETISAATRPIAPAAALGPHASRPGRLVRAEPIRPL